MSGSHRITPTAQYLSACVLELRFPYDAQLVGSLKSEIPPEYRRYDPERRIWTVDSPFRSTLETAISLLRRTYPSAKVIGDPETQPITKTPRPPIRTTGRYTCRRPLPLISTGRAPHALRLSTIRTRAAITS